MSVRYKADDASRRGDKRECKLCAHQYYVWSGNSPKMLHGIRGDTALCQNIVLARKATHYSLAPYRLFRNFCCSQPSASPLPVVYVLLKTEEVHWRPRPAPYNVVTRLKFLA